jgi:hypothetical protein
VANCGFYLKIMVKKPIIVYKKKLKKKHFYGVQGKSTGKYFWLDPIRNLNESQAGSGPKTPRKVGSGSITNNFGCTTLHGHL